MINKAMFKEVQTFKRQGYSKGAIGRALELDPRTVAKYFAMEEEEFRAYRQDHLFRDKAFEDLRGEILEVYGASSSGRSRFRPSTTIWRRDTARFRGMNKRCATTSPISSRRKV